ncbi:anthranilate synthase [Flavobacteriaceae bacterium UJ101]|nr:anthranilate synthase [Flavobacteriaceae bacterium UJ101]
MKILVLDNYDSFTYNLVHAIHKFTEAEVDVYRNDEISLDAIEQYDKILLSPGPGVPDEANILKPLIERYAPTKSIFGVCLGQQAIGEVFGSQLLNTQKVYHGVSTEATIIIENELLFKGLPKQIEIGRYHSWVVDPDHFSNELEITALGPEGEIMALRHKTFDVRGVQFHPESVLTPLGEKMIENWIHN